MKRYITLGLVTLTLAACSAQESVVTIETTTTTTTVPPTTTTEVVLTAPPTTQPEMSDEDWFLMFVHDDTNLEWMYNDYELLQLGRGMCGFLYQGYTADDIFEAMAELYFTTSMTEEMAMDLAALFGYAINSFCPEYAWMLG